MTSMCSLRSSIGIPSLPRDLRHLVVLQQAQVLGDDALGRRALERRGAGSGAAGTPAGRARRRRSDRSPAPRCSARSTSLDSATGPIAGRSRRATRPDSRRRRGCRRWPRRSRAIASIVGLERELPEQVVGERAARRERVLDRRKFLDLLRLRAAGSRRRGSRRRSTRSPGRPSESVLSRCFAAASASGLLGGLRRRRPAASSVGTSSSSGFSTISWFRRSESSSVDIGSSLIACCSDGVRISFWTSLVCSFC